jgi:hypothetical protein
VVPPIDAPATGARTTKPITARPVATKESRIN